MVYALWQDVHVSLGGVNRKGGVPMPVSEIIARIDFPVRRSNGERERLFRLILGLDYQWQLGPQVDSVGG